MCPALDDVGLVVVFGCAGAGSFSVLVPRRCGFVLPLLVVAYFASRRPRSSRSITGLARVALFAGSLRRSPATGSTARWARTRTWPRSGPGTRTVHDLGERVLQPQRRRPLRTGPPLAGGDLRRRGDDRRVAGRLSPAVGRSARRYVLADGHARARREGDRADPQGHGALPRERAAASGVARDGPLRATRGPGRNVTYTRSSLQRRDAGRTARERPEPVHEAQRSTARAGRARRQRPRSSARAGEGTTTMRVPLRPSAGHCTVSLRRRRRCGARSRARAAEHRHARARRALQLGSRTGREVRIVFDVSRCRIRAQASATISAARCAGLVEAAGRRARGRPVRADEPAGAEGDPAWRSTGSPSSHACASCRSRTPGARRGAARAGRR